MSTCYIEALVLGAGDMDMNLGGSRPCYIQCGWGDTASDRHYVVICRGQKEALELLEAQRATKACFAKLGRL